MLRKRRDSRSRRFRGGHGSRCSARAKADPSRSRPGACGVRGAMTGTVPPGTRGPASDPRRPWQSRLLPHRRFRSITPRRRRCGGACGCARRGSRSPCWPGSRSGFVSLFFGFMTALAQDLPQLEVAQLAQQSNGVIYADDGKTVLGVLRSDQYRVLVHWRDIAPVMRNAMVSVEDRRFYQHGAIDPVGMARAAVVNIWTGTPRAGRLDDHPAAGQEPLEAGAGAARARSGARSSRPHSPTRSSSTGRSRRSSRSTSNHDLLRAPGLRRRGRGGRRTSACTPMTLQPQQAALLAGLGPEPHELRPREAPAGSHGAPFARARQAAAAGLHRCLRVSPRRRQAAAARAAGRIGFPPAKKTIANYFVDYVRQQLINLYGPGKALGGGLRVYTTLNPRMQRLALKAVRATLPKRRPEAALVAINPPSGEVEAMVGGRDYTNPVYGRVQPAPPRLRAPAGLGVQDLRAAGGARGGHPAADRNSSRTSSRSACRAGRCGPCTTTRAPIAG